MCVAGLPAAHRGGRRGQVGNVLAVRTRRRFRQRRSACLAGAPEWTQGSRECRSGEQFRGAALVHRRSAHSPATASATGTYRWPGSGLRAVAGGLHPALRDQPRCRAHAGVVSGAGGVHRSDGVAHVGLLVAWSAVRAVRSLVAFHRFCADAAVRACGLVSAALPPFTACTLLLALALAVGPLEAPVRAGVINVMA